MQWVLIAVTALYGGGWSVTMHDFDSQQTCVAASKAIIEAKRDANEGISPGTKAAYRCVRK